VKVEVDEEVGEVKEEEEPAHNGDVSVKKKCQRTKIVKEEQQGGELDENGEVIEKKVKKKRKSKAEKEAELVEMPLAARTVGHRLFIGAHVSAAGGVHQSILNSLHIGANAFALFLKSQRKWVNPPLLDDHCNAFHKNCTEQRYDQMKHVVPHGSYLVNLAHTEKARSKQAYESFLDDLKRCKRLGIRLYNFHPGNDQCGDRGKSIKQLADMINKAHSETSTVVTLLETMAHGGNVLGSNFEDLRDIIALIDKKERVGVCLDTCHVFAAGYDLRTPEAYKTTMGKFEEVIGFKYLRALHINDSKAPFGSMKDLHANIGTGFLGLRSFHNLVNDPRMEGLPLVLETPIQVRDEHGGLVKDEKGKEKEDKAIWAREIKLLESLVGMDTEGEEFLRLEKELQKRGESERNRLLEQVARVKKKAEEKEARQRKKEGKAGKGVKEGIERFVKKNKARESSGEVEGGK
jgi:AP endonuclease 1